MANPEQLRGFIRDLDKKFDATRRYLQGLSEEELHRLYDEAEGQPATDRSHDGLPKGLIWEELDRRSKQQNVLPGTDEISFTPSRPDDGEDQKLSKKIG